MSRKVFKLGTWNSQLIEDDELITWLIFDRIPSIFSGVMAL